MAEQITVEDVLAIQPSSLPGDVIQCMIDAIDAADACLDANQVSSATQKLLKMYGVAHQIVMASDGGEAKTTRGQSGASRTMNIEDTNGIEGTKWGRLLKQMDRYGCVTNLLDNSGGWFFAASIGPVDYE